jgi:hypothetical protein
MNTCSFSRRILDKSSMSFAEHLDDYAPKVFSLCRHIVDVTISSTSSPKPLLLWLTPLALSNVKSKEQKEQFLQIVAAGENSAKLAGFQIFDQLNVLLADGGSFADKNGHFNRDGT